jgi:catechol 2,3-dioxygenase
VANLEVMTNFYHNQVGLDILSKSESTTLLGHNNTGSIELIAQPKLGHAGPREAGLFHNAILFESRGALSRAAGTLITQTPQLFSGTGDHLVSEAFYFNDPENNGLELYFDRPSDTWTWHNGQVAMDTLYIDPINYINSNASERASENTRLGHVHLRIGDINEARKFYVNLLGFDITASMPGALFVSIAGYHHHIGLNTWLSSGAGVRTPTLGLSDITISLSSEQDVSNLASRLEQANYRFTHAHGIVHVADPWGNQLIFTAS